MWPFISQFDKIYWYTDNFFFAIIRDLFASNARSILLYWKSTANKQICWKTNIIYNSQFAKTQIEAKDIIQTSGKTFNTTWTLNFCYLEWRKWISFRMSYAYHAYTSTVRKHKPGKGRRRLHFPTPYIFHIFHTNFYVNKFYIRICVNPCNICNVHMYIIRITYSINNTKKKKKSHL